MPSMEWFGSPNYWKGRSGRKPEAIVNHITAGAFPGCLSWMQNPNSEASSNYLVTREGRIIQLVKDEDTAWANGAVNRPDWPLYDRENPNRYTISIEHEGYYTYWDNEKTQIKDNFGGDGSPTEAQYQATLWLHRQLIEKWGIPIDRDHIIGHYRIDSVDRPNCPGPNFPWDRLFKDLQGGENMPEQWEIDVLKKAEELGIIAKGQHKPDEIPNKAFVLAVQMNMNKELLFMVDQVVRVLIQTLNKNGYNHPWK